MRLILPRQFAGRALSSLGYDELLELLKELRATDPKSALGPHACLAVLITTDLRTITGHHLAYYPLRG
jgi:hypothetical protein